MNTDNKNKPQYAKLPQTVSAAKSRGLVTSLFLTALSARLGYIARVIIDNFPNYSTSISFIPHSQKTANREEKIMQPSIRRRIRRRYQKEIVKLIDENIFHPILGQY